MANDLLGVSLVACHQVQLQIRCKTAYCLRYIMLASTCLLEAVEVVEMVEHVSLFRNGLLQVQQTGHVVVMSSIMSVMHLGSPVRCGKYFIGVDCACLQLQCSCCSGSCYVDGLELHNLRITVCMW